MNGDAPLPPRLDRERRTVRAMVRLSCELRRHAPGHTCSECAELSAYADLRLEKCPYGVAKPTCVNCPIHCYKPTMRERMKDVMRLSGPRMLARHPILAIRHVLDGRKPAPPRPLRTTAA
jgi:YbgA-like uncharacterized protein